jgi:hypothetical protein
MRHRSKSISLWPRHNRSGNHISAERCLLAAIVDGDLHIRRLPFDDDGEPTRADHVSPDESYGGCLEHDVHGGGQGDHAAHFENT